MADEKREQDEKRLKCVFFRHVELHQRAFAPLSRQQHQPHRLTSQGVYEVGAVGREFFCAIDNSFDFLVKLYP